MMAAQAGYPSSSYIHSPVVRNTGRRSSHICEKPGAPSRSICTATVNPHAARQKLCDRVFRRGHWRRRGSAGARAFRIGGAQPRRRGVDRVCGCASGSRRGTSAGRYAWKDAAGSSPEDREGNGIRLRKGHPRVLEQALEQCPAERSGTSREPNAQCAEGSFSQYRQGDLPI